MINAEIWMADILCQLQQVFGTRLQYLGLQGSYRRGEATESSDIDVVVLLDAVALDDLDTYRSIVRAMPEGQKACGFFGSTADLLNWPRHELFGFYKDTDDYYGKPKSFLPVLSSKDAAEAVRIGAAGLMHMLTHAYLYAPADARARILKDACKAAFFVMQVQHWLVFGVYCRSKKELLLQLEGADKIIIKTGLDFSQAIAEIPENDIYSILLRWCSTMLHAASLQLCADTACARRA